MFDDANLGAQLLANPLNIEMAVADILSTRLGGDVVLADPNSPFCFLVEMGVSLAAINHQEMTDGFQALYEKRATDMEDLFKHMSDYEYLHLYSNPATSVLDLVLNKDQIMQNAIVENDRYYRVDIPRQTIFTLGKFTFGLHYPIIIRISRSTGTVITTYDTSEINPMYGLTGNMVETGETGIQSVFSVYEESYSGLNIITLRFPIFQFARSFITEDVISEIGFRKIYKYTNRFYAARIFTYVDGTKIELGQTLSPTIYDVNTPTARLYVDADKQQLTVDIPQVYLTNNMIGSKIYIELYTTVGELDLDLGGISLTNSMINFNLSTPGISSYSNTLKYPVTVGMRLPTAKVVGGSNGYGFEELRERVINNNFYDTVPLSPSSLVKYFEDGGFTAVKTLDNITDRVYTCFRILRDGSGAIVPSAMGTISIKAGTADGVSTIVKGLDDSIVILPTTIFTYNKEISQAIPLPDISRDKFPNLDKAELITEFNETDYVMSPFHIRLDMTHQHPRAITYNLQSPSIVNFKFVKENLTIVSTMVAYGYTIQSLGSGDTGYDIYLSVTKSADIKTLDEGYIKLWVHFLTDTGHAPGCYAEYVSESGNYSIYKVRLTSDFKINDSHQLNFTSIAYNGISEFFIDLDTDMQVTFLISKDVITDPVAEQGPYETIAHLPEDLLSTHYALVRQSVNVHFGHQLDDVLYNSINIAYTEKVYDTYDEDIPLLYEEQIFVSDPITDVPILTWNGDVPSLTVLHDVGDPVLDEFGEVDFAHRRGDIKYIDGSPVLLEDRSISYEVSAILLDAKMYLSEHPDQVDFTTNLSTELESYFTKIRTLGTQVIERTSALFSPINSMGYTTYGVGNALTIKDLLTLSFAANVYVKSYVMDDTVLKTTIRAKIIDIIDVAIATGTISCIDIYNTVMVDLGDYVTSVDILGINGDQELQSLVVYTEDAIPSIKKVLKLSDDNVIYLDYDVTLEFIETPTTYE